MGAAHDESEPSVDPRGAGSQRAAFRPEHATDVRDAPDGGSIARHRWLERDMAAAVVPDPFAIIVLLATVAVLRRSGTLRR